MTVEFLPTNELSATAVVSLQCFLTPEGGIAHLLMEARTVSDDLTDFFLVPGRGWPEDDVSIRETMSEFHRRITEASVTLARTEDR